MKLPHGEKAIVDIRKLRDYCLNPDSPRGSGKARVFAAVLGLTAADASQLQERLLEAARMEKAEIGERDAYGIRFTVDFEMETRAGIATVRSGWIVLHEETVPRLTTCYVKRRKR